MLINVEGVDVDIYIYMENHHFATSIVKTGFGKRQKAPGVLPIEDIYMLFPRDCFLVACGKIVTMKCRNRT